MRSILKSIASHCHSVTEILANSFAQFLSGALFSPQRQLVPVRVKNRPSRRQ